MCAIFGLTRLFSWGIGRFQSEQVVFCEEGRTSWGLDPCSQDVVYPCSHVFFILAPREHGAVIMCLYEEGYELLQVTSFD